MRTFIALFILMTACIATANINPQLSFNSTQSWGKPESLFLKTWKFKVLAKSEVEASIFSLAHSNNFSKIGIEKELEYLVSIQKKRTSNDRLKIEREKHVCGFSLNGYQLGVNGEIDELLLDTYFDARLVGFYFKEHYNRVRPNFLSKKLKPSIKNPPHPAYPSNHTVQAMTMALVLGDIFKPLKEKFAEDALKIGRNRELAGVHYPSDTNFGALLAKKIHGQLNSQN